MRNHQKSPKGRSRGSWGWWCLGAGARQEVTRRTCPRRKSAPPAVRRHKKWCGGAVDVALGHKAGRFPGHLGRAVIGSRRAAGRMTEAQEQEHGKCGLVFVQGLRTVRSTRSDSVWTCDGASRWYWGLRHHLWRLPFVSFVWLVDRWGVCRLRDAENCGIGSLAEMPFFVFLFRVTQCLWNCCVAWKL